MSCILETVPLYQSTTSAMAGGISINTATHWAKGFSSHKTALFEDPGRSYQRPARSKFGPEIRDRFGKNARKSPISDRRCSASFLQPPYSPPRMAAVDAAPSPFAVNNYRDPLLTSAPQIKAHISPVSPLMLPCRSQTQHRIVQDNDHLPPNLPVLIVANDNKLPSLSHAPESQPGSVAVPPRFPIHEIKPSDVCRLFLRNRCSYGKYCKYIHISPSPSNAPVDPAIIFSSSPPDVQRSGNQPDQDPPDIHPDPTLDSSDPPKTDGPHSSVANEGQSSKAVVHEDIKKYVVKLPSQKLIRSKGHYKWGRYPKKARSTTSGVVEAVDVGSGPRDAYLFDVPSGDSVAVVNLPSLRRQKKSLRRMKNHTFKRQPPERWAPATTTERRLEREHSQISDDSNDSLSDGFSNVSIASSHTSIGQDDIASVVKREDHAYVDTLNQREREGPLFTGPSIDRRSTTYLDSVPEKPPGLEHIRPRNMNENRILPPHIPRPEPASERWRLPVSHSNAGQQRKQAVNLTMTISDHSKVEFGPGFEVLEFMTGFESRWIHIKNIPSGVKATAMNQLLEPFGQVTDLRYTKGASTAKAQFSDLSAAVQAATILDGAQAFNTTISVSLSVGHSTFSKCMVQDATVFLIWEPPSRVGYAGYETLEDATAAIAAADGPLRDSFVTPSLHRGLPAIGAYTVRFHGLPPDAVAEEVKHISNAEDVMLERPNYLSLDLSLKIIKPLLQEFGEITFELVLPSSRERLVRAWTTFSSPQIAAAATEYLNIQRQSFFRRCKFQAHHIMTVTYPISEERFLKIRYDLRSLRDSCSWRYAPGTFVKYGQRPGYPCHIKVGAESLSDLRSLKAEVDAILYGEIIRDDGKPVWDRFFSQFVGKAYLESLERDGKFTSIRVDSCRRLIVVFGSSVGRKIVRERILHKFAELKRQKVRTIPLAGRIIGLFMSADLLSLQRRLGPENVVLDIRNRCLRIRGNDQSFELALEVVQRIEKGQGKARQTTSECPVCFSEVTSPVTLDCGHVWCKACLSGYLVAATDNKLFPLTCLGSDASCPELVSITIAQEILSAADFDALVNASFTAYVHSRPDQFYYCPTPDCQQIYRAATQSTVLQCPACLIRICPLCHVEYHDGFDCADRQAGGGSGGEQKFREWSKDHDVKNCPGCKVPIERSEGCNHLTCTRCHTHICWVCLKTFPGGQGVYDHMRSEHGGIGM